MSVLTVKNLKKSFGKKEVLKDISFSINESEILGFLGRNGSGKSTAMKCMTGLMGFDGGEVYICGHDIRKDRIKALENIGVSIESPALYPNLTGKDHYVQMAAWRDISQDRVEEMIEYANLGVYLHRPTRMYSMGMKMRLMLSLVMMDRPKLLILDEPMNGLDIEGVIELRELLLNLKKQGSSILLSSHQLSELEKVSDRVVMIENGHVVYDDVITGAIDITRYAINTDDNKSLINMLDQSDIKYENSEDPDTIGYVVFQVEGDRLGEILDNLIAHDIYVKDIIKESLGLEELYQNVIKVRETS